MVLRGAGAALLVEIPTHQVSGLSIDRVQGSLVKRFEFGQLRFGNGVFQLRFQLLGSIAQRGLYFLKQGVFRIVCDLRQLPEHLGNERLIIRLGRRQDPFDFRLDHEDLAESRLAADR